MPRFKGNLKREECRQCMSYIENSTLGLTYGSPRRNFEVENAEKFEFLFRQLNNK